MSSELVCEFTDSKNFVFHLILIIIISVIGQQWKEKKVKRSNIKNWLKCTYTDCVFVSPYIHTHKKI